MTTKTAPSTDAPLSRIQQEVILVMGDGGSLELDLCHLSLRKGTPGSPGYGWKRVYAATEHALRRKGLIEYFRESDRTFRFILTDAGREVYRRLKAGRDVQK